MELETRHNLYVNYYLDSSVYCAHDSPLREWYAKHYSLNVNLLPLEKIAALGLPMKCLSIVETGEHAPVSRLFASALGDQAKLTASNDRFIEILPPEADKAEGVRQLSLWSGIPLADFVAVGDGLNDLPMLEAAGFSITFNSGDPRLAEHADMVLPPLWEDGMDMLAKVVLGLTESGRFLTRRSNRLFRK
jgi:hydroxymethylpyrimidine pyrophosphatase-like HAD family hydrolase